MKMISKWNNIFLLWLVLICSLPGVFGLLDGGDFTPEVTEEQVVGLGHDFQEDDCAVRDWLDVFVAPNICPVGENRKMEKAEHKAKLAAMEELETEHIRDEDDSDEGAQLHEKTDPLPLTIRPLGLNVAPLTRAENDESAEVEKGLPRSAVDKVVEIVNITEIKSIEDEKESVPPVKEHKPYIVKATPKDVVTVLPVEIANDTLEEIKEVKVEVEEVPKEETIEEKYPASESSVDEELLDQPAATEDIIAPFSQWAEKKLVEEALLKDATKKESEPEVESNGAPSNPISNPSPIKTNGIKLTKNFASPDCSAKIMGANPESQGSGNVITSSKDEYFLNKCTDKAWFVVELCESIKALKVQIANFELYSSSPNQLRISIGNVFPAREKDWMEFGTFTYQDERNIQTFKSDGGVVGKYARVEILSHHGAEHYCPVSMFKVYGISEIDLITEDDPDDDQDDAPEETVDDELSEHIIVKTIKEAVHKVVNVFRPQHVSLVATLNTSSLQGASLRFRLRPEGGQKHDQEVVNRYHMIYYLLATQYNTVRQYTMTMGLPNLLPLMCAQYGVPIVQNTSDQSSSNTCKNNPLPWHFAKFVRVVHGEDFLVALCNVVSMEVGQSRLVEGGRVGEKVNTTIASKGDKIQTMVVETVIENISDEKVVDIKEENIVKDIPVKVSKDKDPTAPTDVDQPPDPLSTPNSDPIPTTQQGDPASSVKPGNTASITNTATQVGQTTWQKLSNRIKALERNVTLSTGFLEELSLKYIKQTEELNNAVKVLNDAINGMGKREELAREREEQLASQVRQLGINQDQLVVRVGELEEEVLARHGLLLLLEVLVIGFVFLLCRPGGGRVGGSNGSLVDTKRSLDTIIRGERGKTHMKQEKRRSSIEVGCLPNGQLGSMMAEVSGVGLSKKQRKRKKRKDSRLGLRNVVEELESDDSKAGDSVYDTFHGAEQRRVVDHRKRSRSWSEQQQEEGGNHSQASMINTSNSMEIESPSRFAVDQVWEQDGGQYRHVEDMQEEDRVFAGSQVDREGGWGKDRVRSEDIQKQHMMYQGRRYINPCLSHRKPAIGLTIPPSPTCKSVRFPGRSRKGSVIRVPTSLTMNGHPLVEVTNMYTMLDHSVHETSACETEGEERDGDKGYKRRQGVAKSTKQKSCRSKSSSPNRQANLIMRRQRDAIRQFQPDQAEWLHKKRDS